MRVGVAPRAWARGCRGATVCRTVALELGTAFRVRLPSMRKGQHIDDTCMFCLTPGGLGVTLPAHPLTGSACGIAAQCLGPALWQQWHFCIPLP